MDLPINWVYLAGLVVVVLAAIAAYYVLRKRS